MSKICLNMIVKNESKIIHRLLQSVLPIIDSFCICDTGSTDDTIQIIEKFFQENKVVGKVVKEPFQDFGHNRTVALKACLGMVNADYILLMDADMILVIDPSIDVQKLKKNLTSDIYYLYQGSNSFFYKNVRIVKNKPDQSYWGVTHEYFKSATGSVYSEIDKSVIFINDIGDGGSKTGKYERDVRLLKKGLEEIPDNDRYTFYLANTYRDMEDYDNAIMYYKKRIEIGGWEQEVWSCYFNIGLCYKLTNDMPNAIFYWLEGYQFYPERIENLYEIVLYYRQLTKYKLAYHFYEIADYQRKTIDFKKSHLFIFNNIYEYKLDYEFTVLGHYYNRHNYDIHQKCMTVLSHPNVEDYLCLNILSNYKFYDNLLYEKESSLPESNLLLLQSIGKNIIKDSQLISSTPSLCLSSSGNLLINQRYVSYKIDDNGNYINRENITTQNVFAKINIDSRNWKVTDEFIVDYDTTHDNIYIGLEDMKLFSFKDDVQFIANRGLSAENITIEQGILDKKNKKVFSKFLQRTDTNSAIEKNWVLFQTKSEMKVIYGWYPLTIGNITETEDSSMNTFSATHQINTPAFFKWVRGSTNGVNINGEIWFICHIVSYENRRYYYHLFVVLDEETLQVKKYSRLFTFEKQPVEYTLGFVYFKETDEFLIGYSIMDKEPKFISIPKSHIEGGNLRFSPILNGI